MRMSIELCILASGSAGNAAILRTPAGVLLIDAGIGPRTLAKRLLGTAVHLADITAVCLAHLDSDHFSPHWVPARIEFGDKNSKLPPIRSIRSASRA